MIDKLYFNAMKYIEHKCAASLSYICNEIIRFLAITLAFLTYRYVASLNLILLSRKLKISRGEFWQKCGFAKSTEHKRMSGLTKFD